MSFVNRLVRAEIGSEDVFLLGEHITETQFGIENHHFMLVSFVVSVFHKVRLHLSWPKEQEMDSFNLVNEAREAELQMSKQDFINQSNKAEMMVTAATASDLCLSVHPFYTFFTTPKIVVPVFNWLCLSGLPQLITSPPGLFLIVEFGWISPFLKILYSAAHIGWRCSQETYIKPVYLYLSYSWTLPKVHRVI